MPTQWNSGVIVRVALALIVLASAAVSVLWSRAVPVFEAPDEVAHFDYAYALASTGHPLRAGDGSRVQVAPNVAVLQWRVGVMRIHFDAEQRASLDYGTPAERATLEAIPSRVPAGYYDGRAPARSPLMVDYPPGYYSVAALAMRAAGLPHAGMLTVFDAARATSIALLVVGLLAWFGALRESGLSPNASLFATALVGLAPLTSFVSSYVQPDNLSFAACGLVLWTALRTRSQGATVPAAAWYGLALALLWLTKFQFGAVLTLVTLPLVVLAIGRRSGDGGAKLQALFLSFVPALLAFALGRWTISGAKSGYFADPTLRGTGGAFGHGLGSGLGFLAHNTSLALQDFFGHDGRMHVSFWGYFGWLDTPLSSGNPGFDGLAANLLAWGTALVALLALAALVRNLVRLAKVVRRRGPASALRVALGDPIANGYYVFIALLLGLYVLTSNAFIAQGRDAYPLETAAFLVTTRYAPKAFPRPRWRRAAGWIGGAGLALFVLIFAPFAITSVEDRYYSPPSGSQSLPLTHLAREAVQPGGHVDDARAVLGELSIPFAAHRPIPAAARLVLAGWAGRPGPAPFVPRMAYLMVDGRVTSSTRIDFPRDDVALALNAPALARSGYHLTLPGGSLRPGRHQLGLEFLSPGGDALLAPVPLPSVEVTR